MTNTQLTETAKLLDQLKELDGEIAKAETCLRQLKTKHQQIRSPFSIRFWRKKFWRKQSKGLSK